MLSSIKDICQKLDIFIGKSKAVKKVEHNLSKTGVGPISNTVGI